jgi:hypothetical protein
VEKDAPVFDRFKKQTKKLKKQKDRIKQEMIKFMTNT